jgi:hypothetical protein
LAEKLKAISRMQYNINLLIFLFNYNPFLSDRLNSEKFQSIIKLIKTLHEFEFNIQSILNSIQSLSEFMIYFYTDLKTATVFSLWMRN